MRFLDFTVSDESIEEFKNLLNQSGNIKKGVLVTGIVSGESNGFVSIDVGLKSEGRVPAEEFYVDGKNKIPEIGTSLPVWLENLENRLGNVVLSYSKALREAGWETLEEYYRQRKTVLGTVVRKVQGGCIVNLSGASAFLPKSHASSSVKDMRELVGKEYPCLIIKMDRVRSNIVVSCRALNDNEQSIGLSEGQVVKGIVKNLTESSAFVDLGSVTGRVNINEISWKKLRDPSEVLKVGQEIEVKVIAISQPNRISLSIKQLSEDPWLIAVNSSDIKVGKVCEVKVKSIDERGAFISFSNVIEGRLRIFDIAWMKRYQSLASFKEGMVLEVKVLEIDEKRHKIYVGLKQNQPNPVEEFSKMNSVGGAVKCKIVQLSDMGYVAQINDALDGFIPQIDMYVSGTLKPGMEIDAYVWDIHTENGHIVLGVKKPIITATPVA